MSLSKRLPIFFFLSITLCFTLSNAVRFDIINNCPCTVWAAAVPGGGMQLNSGGVWIMHNNATTSGRIWTRTGCSFDETGTGCCLTGDCGGLLKCQAYGTPPNTLAEYTLYNFDDYTSHNDKDYYDISLVDGFNVPMLFGDDSTGFISINCTGDIYNQCPSALKADGGCNNPCTVFKTDQYCCNSGSCKSTLYSKFFKDRCPDAISYPKDDQTTTLSAISGANYTVVFCP